MKKQLYHHIVTKARAYRLLPLYLFTFILIVGCSMTKGIPDDDQLFTGLKRTVWTDTLKNSPYEEHIGTTKEEVEAALATKPNGSIFGSSHITVPWSWHLWVYNKYAGKDSKFAKWMTKSFGTPPVLMSKVNPTLRASVARSVLRNNGYFRGDVTFETFTQKNPKKSKIGYTVTLIYLWLNSPELAIARVHDRVLSGGHNTPEPIIRRRYLMGLKYFFDEYIPECDRWILADNSKTPFTVIAEGSKDMVHIKDSEKYTITWALAHPELVEEGQDKDDDQR